MITEKTPQAKLWLTIKSSWRRFQLKFRELSGLRKPIGALIVFLFTLLISLPLFNQGDLNHTVVSSYAYLRGHFFDFYDFNQSIVWANDYLPILYVIFAIWMAPYYFSGMPVESNSIGNLTWGPGEIVSLSGPEIVWAKLLLVIFFWISVVILYKIAKLIHPGDARRQSVAVWAYVLSPFVLFSFGVFSQYDIIGVVFTLAAIHKLLQRKMLGFAILVGVALCFKFFAALLVLPLLLLGRKSMLQVFGLGLISLLPLLAQFALYWSNESFQARIFVQLTSKAGGAATSWEAYAGVTAYFLILIAAFYSSTWKGSLGEKTVFVVLASYGLMLNMVVWHPQWVIILAPFIALMMSFIRQPTVWLVWESIAFVAFIGFVVTFFQGNVDGIMISRGALGGVVPDAQISISELYSMEMFPLLLPLVKLFFISPAVLMLFHLFRVQAEQRSVPKIAWFFRSITLWIAFIGPAFAAIYLSEVDLSLFTWL